MKKVLVIVSSLFLFSCSVQTSVTVKTEDVKTTGVTHVPVLADLDVKEGKVKTSVTSIIRKGFSVNSFKKEAEAKLLAEHNGDILIEPNYVIEKKFNKMTITVTGYIGTYKNFRKIK